MPERLVCLSCEVLTTDDLTARCWVCDGPLINANQFTNPASSPFRNPVLSMLEGVADA